MSSEEWAGGQPLLPKKLQECVVSAIGSHGLLLCKVVGERLACCTHLGSCKAGMRLQAGRNICKRA